MSVLLIPILLSIPAVILGHMSRAEIQRSMGRLKGDGMAMAGLILGYGGFAFYGLIMLLFALAMPAALRARTKADELVASNTVRTLNTVQLTYSTVHPGSGYAPDLATLGPGPGDTCTGDPNATFACLIDAKLGNARCKPGVWCIKDNFKYSLRAEGSPPSDYVIIAVPVLRRSGARSFCSTSDGIVRARSGPAPLSPALTVAQCQAWASM